MNDINEEFVAKGYNKIKKSLEKAVTKGRMTEEAKGRGTCKPDYNSLAGRCQGCGFCNRSRIGKQRNQAGDFQAARQDLQAGSDPRIQYIFSADHRDRGGNRQTGSGDRYTLFQPGTGYEAAGDRNGSADIRSDLSGCSGSGSSSWKKCR